MQAGTCPKCGAADIYHRQARRNRPGSHTSLRPVYSYVCRNCGYLETYIRREDVAALVQAPEWTRVPAAQAPTPIAVTGETIRLDDQSLESGTTAPDEPLDLALDHACPVCQSDMIIPFVRIRFVGQRDRNEVLDLLTEVESIPDTLLFGRNAVRNPLYARVCGNCGYMAFFAKSPHVLYDAHLDANQ